MKYRDDVWREYYLGVVVKLIEHSNVAVVTAFQVKSLFTQNMLRIP